MLLVLGLFEGLVLQVGIAGRDYWSIVHLLSNKKKHSLYDHAFFFGPTGVPFYMTSLSIIHTVYSDAIKIFEFGIGLSIDAMLSGYNLCTDCTRCCSTYWLI